MDMKPFWGLVVLVLGCLGLIAWTVGRGGDAQAAARVAMVQGHGEEHHERGSWMVDPASAATDGHAEGGEHPEPPAGSGSSEAERALYLTPKGRYTAADIQANGPLLPSQKFRGIHAKHDMHPPAGARICPITHTLANPAFTWIVGGKRYQFCCPPCVDEFVQRAKEKPASILAPEAYVKSRA